LLTVSGSNFKTRGAVYSTYAKEVTHSVSSSELDSSELLLDDELFFDFDLTSDFLDVELDELLLELLDDDELLLLLCISIFGKSHYFFSTTLSGSGANRILVSNRDSILNFSSCIALT